MGSVIFNKFRWAYEYVIVISCQAFCVNTVEINLVNGKVGGKHQGHCQQNSQHINQLHMQCVDTCCCGNWKGGGGGRWGK